MNSKILIGIFIVAAAIGGFAIYTISSGRNTTQQPQTQTSENNAAGTIEEGANQMVDASDNPVGGSEKYVTISDNTLQAAQGKKRVLYFYANWCPTCKVANEEFTNEIQRIPDDIVVIRTNYNDSDTDQEEKDLAKQYNITYQHTFVQVDENGNEVKKWNGGGIEELVKNIK